MLDRGFSFEKVINSARLLIPHMLLLFLLLLNVINLPLLPADIARPQLVLMAVYYWAIYRPTLLPPSFCFIIGLLMDILTGMPPGINALVFVTIQWVVRGQRRFLMGQPYSTIWAVFGLVAFSSTFVQWALYGLTELYWVPVMPLIYGALISMLLFPVTTFLLVAVHRILPVASRAFP